MSPNSIAKRGYSILTRGGAESNTTKLLDPDAMLTSAELAAYLKVSLTCVEKWRLAGNGPRFVKLVHAVRYRRKDVLAFVAENVRASTSATAAPDDLG